MAIDDDDMEMTRVSSAVDLSSTLEAKPVRDRPYLIVLSGNNVGEMHRVEGETIIGRGTQASLRLSDDGVSRRHARIFMANGLVVVEDLGSANGVFINGTKVTSHVLQDGDKIQLGSTTILKFTYHDRLEENFQRQMYDAALRDGLTKAFNKKHFLDRLSSEFAFARRHHSPLAVAMIDVDFFKRVNDTYGHLAGDYVLARLASVAAQLIRTEDVFARYGGEEFGIIGRGSRCADLAVLGERLRATVQATHFEHEGRHIPVTISVGIAAFPEIAVNEPLELVAAADEALYEAKRTGRNRVLFKR
jgi:diguanylate cyclase (GGDEF)-like protein